MASKNKTGHREGPHWNPMLRAFVDALKSGMIPTAAARAAKYKNPKQLASRLMRNPLVMAAMAEHAEMERKAEQKAADGAARKIAVSKGAVIEKFWELMCLPPATTKNSIVGQVRAGMALTEVLGMKISAQDPDKFEGFTDQELEQYAKDGTVPERYASRFGAAPGRYPQIM